MENLITFITVIAWIVLVLCITRTLGVWYNLFTHSNEAYALVNRAYNKGEIRENPFDWSKELIVGIICGVWIYIM